MSTLADVWAALAGCYAHLTPPAGRRSITLATSTPPNGIATEPFVIIWPRSGDLTLGSDWMAGEHEAVTSFYYGKHEADIPREAAALADWLPVLIGATFATSKLGLTDLVDKVLPIRWEMGVLTYAGIEYDGISITHHVWTTETISLVPA